MIEDIKGCQASTLKRAFVGGSGNAGIRNINPLDPSYFYPGGAENIDHLNDAFGLAQRQQEKSSMGVANFRKASALGINALKEEFKSKSGTP